MINNYTILNQGVINMVNQLNQAANEEAAEPVEETVNEPNGRGSPNDVSPCAPDVSPIDLSSSVASLVS